MGEALKMRAGMAALIAAASLAILALAAAPGAKAANAGDEFQVGFNHVGIAVGAAILGDVNQMILKPSDGIGTLEMNAEYTNSSGDFVVPQDGGLVFPPLNLNFDGIEIGGTLGLDDDATGNYNEATGAMTLAAKISLTLGVSDAGALAPGVVPNGPLECKLSPINAYMSTGYGWPAAGDPFTPGGFTEGALSGAWTVKPPFIQLQGTSCALLRGIFADVGGLWLGNYTVESANLPASTASKPAVNSCPVGLEGNGTNCAVPLPRAILGGLSFASSKATAKRGKTVSLVVRVRNTGNAAGTATVALSSSSKAVTLPKTVRINVPAGATGQATVKVKAGKKAGKATITAKLASASTKATVTVK
jgi:hypothetical protein